MKRICELCPHSCELEEGQSGFCRARANISGKINCLNYGKITSLSLDPIEKKPFRRFFPGSMILSVGSFGCNMHCPFCQNSSISWSKSLHGQLVNNSQIYFIELSPNELIQKALELVPNGNIGIAHTYNEPLIGYEYVMDCAKIANKNNLKTVLVTNGYINEQPLIELLPFIDALNIDLKSFSPVYYKKLKGNLETVKRTIALACAKSHVEVTTLVIPDENDSIEEITALARWLASINRDIPLHLSRFFPHYKYNGLKTGNTERLYELRDAAKKFLTDVCIGNV